MATRNIRIASILTLTLAAFAGSEARAQLVAYDGFGNGPLADLHGSTGGTGWSGAWSYASTDPTNVSGHGLTYPGLATTLGAAVTPVANGVWPSSIYRRTFQALPANANSVYVSFLMRDDAAWGIWGGLTFGTYPYAMTVGSPLGYYAYGLQMSQGLGDISNKPLVKGETTLVVVKISKNPGSGGINYRMYLDPTIGAPEPTFPAATYGLGLVNALPTFLSIDNGTGFTTDEIRVGLSWASVLPAAPSPWKDLGFAKPGVNGAPHLTGVGSLVAGAAVSIELSNASPTSWATLILGSQVANLPVLGGVLVPQPAAVLVLATDAAGSITLHSTWPAGLPAGTAIRMQYWIQDAAATFGVAASNALEGVQP